MRGVCVASACEDEDGDDEDGDEPNETKQMNERIFAMDAISVCSRNEYSDGGGDGLGEREREWCRQRTKTNGDAQQNSEIHQRSVITLLGAYGVAIRIDGVHPMYICSITSVAKSRAHHRCIFLSDTSNRGKMPHITTKNQHPTQKLIA